MGCSFLSELGFDERFEVHDRMMLTASWFLYLEFQ